MIADCSLREMLLISADSSIISRVLSHRANKNQQNKNNDAILIISDHNLALASTTRVIGSKLAMK